MTDDELAAPRTCAACGKEYAPVRRKRKYCCNKCAHQSASQPPAQFFLPRADISIAGRRLRGARRRFEILGEDILRKLKAESGKLTDRDKQERHDQACTRLRNSIAEVRCLAEEIPDCEQAARILSASFNLMSTCAEAVSRLEWKRVPRFFHQRSGHKSGDVRARKAQEGWQVLALTIAKEKNPRLSVARVAHNVICDERWSTNGSRPKERAVYDFLRRNINAWRNEERLQVN